jgi:transcriptional regulator with GAF, ATPase, and Fis domain
MSQPNLEQHIQDIEIENSNLASLYVALSQLHSSLDVNEVLGVIIEIVLNFVGADAFAIMIADETGTLRPLAAHAVERDTVPSFSKEGPFAVAFETGEPQVAEFEKTPRKEPLDGPPVVCVPLHAAGDVIGVLAVWTFLPQKEGFAEIDHEIIQLLSKSAGTALEAARLAMSAPPAPGSKGYYEAFSELVD